jgi:transcription antitermination factor NusG
MSMSGELYWGVIQTYVGQETRAIRHLDQQEYASLCPRIIVDPAVGPRPMFPGYVFVEIDLGRSWTPIRNTPGVLRLLLSQRSSIAPYPERVPEIFIESLKSCLLLDAHTREGTEVVRAGTVVRALRGALTGHDAIVTWSRERRLGLLFQIFNRQVEVEFALEDVQLPPQEGLIRRVYEGGNRPLPKYVRRPVKLRL